MASSDIMVARRTAALVFGGRTVTIQRGVTLARVGHPILDAAGEMFEPAHVHFEVAPTGSAKQETPPEPAPEPEPPVEPEQLEQPAAAPDTKAVRAWAREQGIDVPPRGKLPADVVEAYQAAQG